MAREVQRHEVLVAAGVLPSAPAVTDMATGVRRLRQVRWHLPAGCAGLVGFYLSMGKVQVQPLPAGTWVTGDNHGGIWVIDDQPDSGAWQVTAYNTGAHPHTILIELHVDLVDARKQRRGLWPDVLLSEYSSQMAG